MGQSHLTEAHRSVIAQLRQAGMKLHAIGQLIGYSKSTISRELVRNATAPGVYDACGAQQLAAARCSRASRWPHLGQALWEAGARPDAAHPGWP
jgi:IS30 family transposase